MQEEYVVRKDLTIYDEWSKSVCSMDNVRIERHLMIILPSTSVITCDLVASSSGIDFCTFCT